MPKYGCFLSVVCPIMMNTDCYTVHSRIDCKGITQSNIVNECFVKFRYSYSAINTVPYALILKSVRRTQHDARISFVYVLLGFPQGMASLYLIHKRINICDTNTFKTIAAVDAKVIPEQFKCTHEMGFESIVNQIL